MEKNSQIFDSDVNTSFADERQTKPETNRKKFICNKCGKCFAYERIFKSHVDACKPKPKKFGCNECGKSFAYKEILKSHVDVAHAKYYTLDVVQKE